MAKGKKNILSDISPADKKSDDGLSPPPTQKRSDGSGKGKVYQKYHDRTEEYCPVTRNDLMEAVEIGFLQQALVQGGTFFFSGAFWLLIDLVIKGCEKAASTNTSFEFTAWMAMCLLSMFFGLLAAWAGQRLSNLKQKKLKKYFPEAQNS